MRRALALTALLSGAALAATFPQTVTHDAGRTLLQSQPKRVVVLGGVGLELLFALGVTPVGYATSDPVELREGQRLRGVTVLGGRLDDVTYVGMVQTPSLETVAALRPDLIVVTDPYGPQPDFGRIAPTLVYSVADWRQTLPRLGAALGRGARARQVLANFAREVRLGRTLLAPVARRSPTVGYAILAGQRSYAYNAASPAGQLLSALGFQVVLPQGAQPSPYGFAPLSAEGFTRWKADHKIVVTASPGGVGTAEAQALNVIRRGGGRVTRLDLAPERAAQGPYSTLALLRELRSALLGR